MIQSSLHKHKKPEVHS